MEKAVLITGAADRLGRRIALDLSEAGYYVWIHYNHSREKAQELLNLIHGQGHCIQADFRDIDAIDDMFTQISRSGCLPQVLINNAATILPANMINCPIEVWNEIMNVNLRAVWYCSNCFYKLPSPDASPRRVINIGDAGIDNDYTQYSVYSLSKTALKALTFQLAEAFAPDISVALLSPGLVRKAENQSDELWNNLNKKVRIPSPDPEGELVKAVHFLLSTPFATGTELKIDGGYSLNHGQFPKNRVK